MTAADFDRVTKVSMFRPAPLEAPEAALSGPPPQLDTGGFVIHPIEGTQ